MDLTSSKKKTIFDQIFKIFFLIVAIIAASSIIFIVVFILIQGIKPFVNTYPEVSGKLTQANFITFITSTTWTNLNYGALGALINTLYLTFLATLIALPVSVLSALFIVRIAPKPLAIVLQNVVELLAAIPSIIFGLFGSGVINPLIRDFAMFFGVQTAGGVSGLSTVIVLAIMMIPTITMLSVTSMKAVKKPVIEASLALGASKTQTDFKIVMSGAKSGIMAALILGVGRALGEATAVTMVCGNNSYGPVWDLFDVTRTLTSTMMNGIHESSGITYDIRFSVGILLIVTILVVNVILSIVKKVITRYEQA